MSARLPIRSCRRARAAILRGLDGELALERRLALEEHLASCVECARFEARATSLEEALRSADEPAEDLGETEEVVSGVLRAIDEPSRDPERPGRSWRSSPWFAAAAAALVLGGLALWKGLGRRDEDAPRIAETNLAAVPPVPSSAPETPDPVRIADLVRENLRTAFGDEALAPDVAPFVRNFESLSGSILSWPLARVAESLLADPDPKVAAAAARYLGLRGDRVSAPRVATALGRPGVGPAAVRALGDLCARDLGMEAVVLDALQAALRDPALTSLARDVLGDNGGAGPARVLEQEFLERLAEGSDLPDREAWLGALARTGPSAVASFLRLAHEGSPDVLAHLVDVEDAGGELARILARSSPAVPRTFLADAIEILQPPEALVWVEARASEPRSRTRALACLASWREAAAVGVFLRLDELGTVPEPELLASFRAFAERQGRALVEAVEHLERTGEATLAGRFLELLLASQSTSAAPALVALARSSLLSSGDRSRAALGVAELGGPEDARALLAFLRESAPAEREIQASILITAWKELDPDEVRASFAIFTPRGARRVEEALLEVSRRGPGPVALARVSRALQGANVPRNPDTQPLL